MLYLFVEKYSKSLLKPLRSFAEGLKRDIDAVENAVAYDYSNGFVEGTNSRLKMIKRTMYGRYGRQLLEAKLRYMGYNNNNGELRKNHSRRTGGSLWHRLFNNIHEHALGAVSYTHLVKMRIMERQV